MLGQPQQVVELRRVVPQQLVVLRSVDGQLGVGIARRRGDEVRRELWPRRRVVLERLAETARAEGRPSEAELYEMMAASEEE